MRPAGLLEPDNARRDCCSTVSGFVGSACPGTKLRGGGSCGVTPRARCPAPLRWEERSQPLEEVGLGPFSVLPQDWDVSQKVRYRAVRVSVPGPDPTGGCGVDGDRDADHPLPLPP
jgi:hypothetical protein